MDTWHVGIPNVYETQTGIWVHGIVWIWALIKAYGMYDFARARYQAAINSGKKWDINLGYEENMSIQAWSYVPGCAFRENAVDTLVAEMRERGHPDPARVIEILREAHAWLNEEADAALSADAKRERGWGLATDQPWVPFPERG
uniref:Uncharacterized protein n=1 Tax=Phaeomonas parva TaxID=124430 RepID=A0A7S1XUE6_9STRA|mmetsp:Transcript_38054/g.119440  ORF Transcript_38054/g.119440 Transcript_38054/m.119440 type:complete len:144 (+) Transcript_38054:2-433(+)